jgi:hypothetical protein
MSFGMMREAKDESKNGKTLFRITANKRLKIIYYKAHKAIILK